MKKHCPACNKDYSTKYPTKSAAIEAKDPMGIEQHISGVCSDKCWDDLFPPADEESEAGLDQEAR